MIYGKMAKKFMADHLYKMGPPEPTEKEKTKPPEWLGASPHYQPPEKKKPEPPPTALKARRKGHPATSTAEID